MKAQITIEMNGAAFESPGPELARILRHAAWVVRLPAMLAPGFSWALVDINGNTVGRIEIVEDSDEG